MRALPSKNVAAKAGPVNSSKQAASKSVTFSAIGTRKNGQGPGGEKERAGMGLLWEKDKRDPAPILIMKQKSGFRKMMKKKLS
jgi:hypothetical protein